MDRSYVEEYWAKTRNWDAFRASYFPDDENAKAHRRSRWFAGLVRSLGVKSVLEIGCNCGRNLHHIQRECPEVSVAGIDLNPEALAFARTKVKGELVEGSARDLKSLVPGKFDLVFSMAVMIHVAPSDVASVLEAMTAASERYVFLAEHGGDGSLISGKTEARPSWRVDDQFLWTHDFGRLFREKGLACEIQPIPQEYLDIGLKDLFRCDLTRRGKHG